MERLLVAGLLALLSAPLAGQNVTMSMAALSPVTFTTTSGTATIPAGPLPFLGFLNAPGGGTFSWNTGVSMTDAQLMLAFHGASPAAIGPSQLLLTIASQGPASMPLRYEAYFDQLNGTGALQMGIDVGNDGAVDWQYGPTVSFVATAPDVSVQPLLLRLIVDYQHVLPGGAPFVVRFWLRAVRDGIYALPLATNCGLYNPYSVGALFDNSSADLMIRSQSLALHVVGLTPAPTLLPPALTLTVHPCLLVPSLDYVVPTGTLYLAVPQSLRPLVLYSQVAGIPPGGGLLLSDTYQIMLL